MKTTKCPICGYKNFVDENYAGAYYGMVERYCYCYRCGYTVEQYHSESVEGFDLPAKKGYKLCDGIYIPKNWRKRKRVKRKYGIKYDNRSLMLRYY